MGQKGERRLDGQHAELRRDGAGEARKLAARGDQHGAARRPGQQRTDLTLCGRVVEHHQYPAAGEQAAISVDPLLQGRGNLQRGCAQFSQEAAQDLLRSRREFGGAA